MSRARTVSGTVLLALLLGAPAPAAAPPRLWALLVGVSEYPLLRERLGREVYESRVRLSGPPNDVAALRSALISEVGAAPERVSVLTGWSDDTPLANPTRENILRALVRLTRAVAPGDRALFFYAGHGSRVPDASGDEDDGLDEVLLPADVRVWDGEGRRIPGAILDDEVGARLAALREAGAAVWAVFDCCHAGTLVRGGDGAARTRRLAGDLLEVPVVAARTPSAKRGAERGALLEVSATPGLTATYAAAADQRASELRLPRGAPDAAWHGLLSWALTEDLKRTRGAGDLRGLDERLARACLAAGVSGARPFTEGDLALTLSDAAPPPAPPVVLALPEPRLALGLVDASGAPIAWSAPIADVAALAAQLGEDARFPRVNRPEEADWLVVRSGAGRFLSRPAAGGDAGDATFEGPPTPERLAQVARVEGLRRLAATRPGPSHGLALDVQVSAPGEGAAPASLADGGTLRPGDNLRVVVRNEGAQTLDTWVLLLDASYGVTVVFPGPQTTPRLAPGAASAPIEAFAQDASLGTEHLLAIVSPADPAAPPLDLRWLEAPPLQAAAARARAPGGAGGLSALLAAYAAPGPGAARAPAGEAAGTAGFVLRSWVTAWGPLAWPDLSATARAVPRPGPAARAQDEPETWLAGPRVAFLRPHPTSPADVLLAGEGAVGALGVDPRGLPPEPADADALSALALSGTLRPPLLLLRTPEGWTSAYDTDLDGTYDLRLSDLNQDGWADVRATRVPGSGSSAWQVEAPVRVPWLCVAYVRWPDPALAEAAILRLRTLAR